MYWNKELFKINITEDKFQTKLEKLIIVREKNNFKNHMFKSEKGSDETVRGELNNDRFTIWRTNRNWSGIFYPIFKGRLYKINNTRVIEIKTRFNPFAELIVLILLIGMTYGVLTDIIIQENNELKFIFRRSLIGILILLIFQAVPLISYYNLKNQTIKSLEEYFELNKVKLKKRKQR
jgi:hypothetical protein